MTTNKLADATAIMMGLKLVPGASWSPHTDYNHCRIVEDWICTKGLRQLYMKNLRVMHYYPTRSTPEQRCRAALAAWKWGNKKKGKTK